ncbi:hypothetical protein JCM11491_004730 [Sporobolomyces phaffii]
MRTSKLTTAAGMAVFATSLAAGQSLGSSLGSISSTCQSAALALLGSDFATCSNLQGLLGIATSSSGSLVTPVNTWLGGLCSQGNCSTSAIQNATSVIDQGCSSDISSGNELITVLRSAIENFNTEKEAVCLRSTSNNTYCLTSLLSEIQNATDSSLSITSIASLNLTQFEQIPAATVCTDCNSALLYKFAQSGSLNQTELKQAQTFCKNDQFGTAVPSTVSSAAAAGGSNSSTTGTNSSSSGSGTSGATSSFGGLAQVVAVGLAGVVGISVLF